MPDRRPNHLLPLGVLIAEADREGRTLREHIAHELRVVDSLEPYAALHVACPHEEMTVIRQSRDLSDHETAYGQCVTCREWIVSTTWFSRRGPDEVEVRPMTARERAMCQLFEGDVS